MPKPDSRGLLLLQEPFGSGRPFTSVGFSTFPDGEVLARAAPTDVTGLDVTVVWSTATPRRRPNDSLLALLQLIEVLGRAGARRLHCFLPYLPYQRQDRVTHRGAPLSAALALRLLHAAGADQITTLDPHSMAALGGAPLVPHSLSADVPLAEVTAAARPDLVVSPDVGGRARAEDLAAHLGVPSYTVGKLRVGETTVVDVLPPRLVEGRHVLVRDDLASTGSTLLPLVGRLREAGAAQVTVALTHLLCDAANLACQLGARVVHTNSCGQTQADVDVVDLLLDHLDHLDPPAGPGEATVTPGRSADTRHVFDGAESA